MSDAECSRIERAFREQFEERGLYIEKSQLEQIRSVLLNTETQLRRASVLFVDLCHYTELSRRLKPDETARLLNDYYQVAVQAIYRHHGFIVKFIGDAILAIFGAPLAYDRDTESCVRAALELRDLVTRLGTKSGRTLESHSGIATGEVLSAAVEPAGVRQYDIAGDAVNLASRLQSKAQPGEILVCQATGVAIQGLFDLTPTKPLRLKNVPGPYVAWHVAGEKPKGGARRPVRTEFIGRGPELQKVHECFQRALEGHPAVLEIVGEPGVGKSRLVNEAIHSFEGNTQVFSCECTPHGKESLLQPLVELVRRICAVYPGDSLERTEQKVSRFCRRHRIAAGDVEAIGYLLGFPDAIETMARLPFPVVQQKVFHALEAIVLSPSNGGLRILCLDDIQWMDRLTGQWLEGFVQHARGMALVVVLIYRIHERPDAALPRTTVRIRLGPLPQRFRSELLQKILGADYRASDVRDVILNQAGGNPLFLEEIARLAAQLERSGDRRLTGRLREMLADTVPESLYSIIQYRIDRLERRTRAVLECAAVLGQRFSLHVIKLFEAVHHNLMEQLAVLRGLQFLEEYPPPPDLEYAFFHPLAREVAYRNLPESQRRTLHGQIAEQMEQYLGDRIPTYFGTLAYHFEKAGNIRKAFCYTMKSGQRAAALFANREALAHFEKSRVLLEAMPDREHASVREAAVLSTIGRLRRILGDVAGSVKALARALRLAGERGNQHLQAECAYELAAVHQATGGYPRATQYATQALQLARRQQRRPLEAQCHNILGMIAWGQSHYDDALAEYQNVFDLHVEAEAPGVVADAHNNAGLIHWQHGRYAAAQEEMRQCLRLGREMGDRFRIAATVMNIGILEERQGRFQAARRSFSNALRLSEEIGFRQAGCACYANLSNVDLLEGKPREALDHAARSRDIARDIDDRRSESVAEENFGLAYLMAGDYPSAQIHFNRSLRIARQLGDIERQVSVGLGQVEWELATRKDAVATAKIRSLFKTIDSEKFRDHLPRALRNLGRILARRPEQRHEAEAALRQALEESMRLSNIPERNACRRELAALRHSET
jgi:class 3 adenylate cyclase/tetratricopeptide (TPR) repeat protein